MKMKIFGIYDSKAEAFLNPFFMKSKGEAIRAVSSLVADANHNFCKYAADFTLFELGEFEDNSGNITIHDAKINLGCLLEFKKDVGN